MKKVRFLNGFVTLHNSYIYGQEETFSADEAEMLIKAEIAEYVEDEVEKPVKKSRKKAGE